MGMTEIGIEQARQTLGDLVNQALYAGQVTYITRRGKRVAAVVPLERIMQTVPTYNTTEAVRTLTSEGFSRADVQTAVDSLIDAGLELPQPDDGYEFTEGEVDVLRDQLATGAHVVVIEASNADGSIWEAVEAAGIVRTSHPEETADDIAAWVVQNQNAATGPGAARVRVWEGADLDAVHARPADAEREIPAAQMFAKYTQEGRVSIVTGDDEQVSDLGHFDADGGTWEDEVREIVRAAGWEPVSGWDSARVGEDNEDNSIAVVKRAD
jgi:prevent-host-death family protein